MTKHEIAESEATTPSYVQQLMAPLQAAGLVTSFRGKLGGFKLGRPAHTITVADVIRATEGEFRLAHCYDGEGCARVETCPTRSVWMGATALLNTFFEQTTIATLAKREREATACPTPQDASSPL